MVNQNSPFGNFLDRRPGQQMGPPGGIPDLGQPKMDPRIPLLGTCPMGCRLTPIHFTPPMPIPELVGKNLVARCMGCLCRWEVDPSARLAKVLSFEQQVAEAMLDIQKRVQAASPAPGQTPGRFA